MGYECRYNTRVRVHVILGFECFEPIKEHHSKGRSCHSRRRYFCLCALAAWQKRVHHLHMILLLVLFAFDVLSCF